MAWSLCDVPLAIACYGSCVWVHTDYWILITTGVDPTSQKLYWVSEYRVQNLAILFAYSALIIVFVWTSSIKHHEKSFKDKIDGCVSIKCAVSCNVFLKCSWSFVSMHTIHFHAWWMCQNYTPLCLLNYLMGIKKYLYHCHIKHITVLDHVYSWFPHLSVRYLFLFYFICQNTCTVITLSSVANNINLTS